MQINSFGSDQNRLLEMLNRRSISQMASEVQSGDISGAQKTLASVQQVEQSLGLDPSASSSSAGVGFKTNFDPTTFLGAVQSGDLQGAQSAWAQVQANSQSAWSGQSDPDGDADGANSGMRNDLTNLLTSVSSGDVSGMQAAGTAVAGDLTALLGGASGDSNASGQAGSQPNASDDPLLKDLQSLVTAAQSGDPSGAQSALQQLQQDMQTVLSGSGHHHHHHHHDAADAGQVNPAASPAPATGTQPPAASTDPASASPEAAI